MDPECDEDPLISMLSAACLGCLVSNEGDNDGPPPIEPCLSDGVVYEGLPAMGPASEPWGGTCFGDYECNQLAGEMCDRSTYQCVRQACTADTDCTYYQDQYCDSGLCSWIYYMGVAPTTEPAWGPSAEPSPAPQTCFGDDECNQVAGEMCDRSTNQCMRQACTTDWDCTYYQDQYCDSGLCSWNWYIGIAPTMEPAWDPASEPEAAPPPSFEHNDVIMQQIVA